MNSLLQKFFSRLGVSHGGKRDEGCGLQAKGCSNFRYPISPIRSSSRLGLLAAAVMTLGWSGAAQAQFNLTSTNYTQNFDGLGTGSSTVTGGNLSNVSSTLNGWYFLETGSSANTTITAGTGTGSSGDTYNLGATSASGRTLGQLRSGNLVSTFGFWFSNSLGSSITNLIITYKGETWRVGATGRADSMTFEYNSTATALNSSGTWTSAGLGFTNNSAASTASGSLLQTANISNNLAVTIPNGGTLFIRWTDVDASGADDAIGINDFTLTAQVQAVAPTVTTGSASGVSTNSATLAGNITATGGANSTERGFFVSTTSGFADGTGTKISESGSYGTGAFSLSATGLSPSTAYYFKAFATSPNGTSYGSQGTFTTPDATASNPPTLAAATVATVDGAFDVTFTDDPAWRSGITSITVDGVSLTAGWSASEVGKITFTPSASVPTTALQVPGTKAIVIKSTGYLDASVNQALGVGQASKLVVTTQPAAPAFNGLVLGTQPVVALQDKYGNATANTDSVTAAVGAGTWTLGGTATVAAVNGTATFSGLTATSTALVTGATISFTSGSLTGATSSGFNIPAPLVPGEILISQVYGAGGNSGATYNQDYVELYNPGSLDKNLAGWSIQYSSANATSWSVQALSGTIKAGKYFLVSLASGGSAGSGLPTADLVGGATSLNLSATTGKVALANTTTAFTTAYPTAAVDFVGFGTANAFEGSAVAPAPSATTAIFRAGNGATDSNNNGTDFTAAPPNPRNSTFGEAVGSITLNPTSITNLTAPVGGVSVVQSYVVVGTSLGTNNLVVTPSLGLIEISTNSAADFSTNPITFVPSAGVVSNTVYVRVTNSTATNYSGTITNASGLAGANLPVSGTIYALAEYYSMASGNYSETFSSIASWTAPTTGSWQGLVAGGTNTVPAANTITAATLGFGGSTTTGIQKGTENLLFLTTGSTDNSTSIGADLLLNFTGRKAGNLSFDAATVINSTTGTDNRVSTLRVYSSTNGTDWSEILGGGLPFISTNNVAGNASVSVSLPSSLDNAGQGRLRFYVHNGTGAGTGNRPKISIDNVAVTSTLPGVAPTITSTNAFSGTVGVAFSNNITATGDAPIAFSGTGLPGRLSVASGGAITGTPEAAGTFNATLTATNSAGTNNQAATFTIAKGSSTISATGSTSFTYSGSPQGPDTSTTSGSGGAVTYSYAGAGYGPSATKPTAVGSYTVTASVAGDTNYNGATSSAYAFTIGKATPSITAAPTASAITAGAALSASSLNGGSASVPGTFAWTSPSTVPGLTGSYGVTFTPTDTANYNTATTTVSVTVNPAAPSGSSFSGWLGTTTPSADLLLQYAYGASSVSNVVNRSNLPSAVMSNNSLVMTYYVRKEATNPNLVIPQVHTNLSDSNGWGALANSNIATVATNTVDGVDVVKKTATVPTSDGARKFLRLKVSE